MVERELLSAKRELLEKDQRIAHLQEKVKLLERSMQHGETESQTVRDLKSKCLGYQKQIEEMEVCVCMTTHTSVQNMAFSCPSSPTGVPQ